jgi:Protein of unknown function (DUF4058)
MKNPFPGMNPFLEDHWQDVHTGLTIYIRDQLQAKLPSDLVARAEEQVAIDEGGQQRALRPDVKVVEPAKLHEPAPAYAATGTGDIVPATPFVVLIEPDVHRWVEILDPGGRLVTVLEVLSPKNKSDEGQAAYRRRQRTYISAAVNLVEIDLLRKGERVLSVPLSEIPDSAWTPYMVCVYRATDPDQREIYPMKLRDRLPAIRVPLRRTDPDAVLDLQSLIDQAFERGRYWLMDYKRELQPPLLRTDADWADTLLKKAGLR